MSHELEVVGDQASFASARLDAWHGLGQVVDHTMTAEEVLKEAHLANWDVRKQEIFTPDQNGEMLLVPGRYSVVRTSPWDGKTTEPLGVVGDGYTIVQNEAHAELLNVLVEESGAHFETAGAIRGGRVVFVSMKLPDSMLIGGVDAVDTYIVAMNSMDGSKAFTLYTTEVRPVCANTLNWGLRMAQNTWTTRHTSRVEKNLRAQARQALELTFKRTDAFSAEAEQLINTSMTQTQFEELIRENYGAPKEAAQAAVTRAEKRVDKLTELFADASTHKEVRNTAWAGLNALTEYSDHFAPARGEDKDMARLTRAALDPAFKDEAHRLITEWAGLALV